jgi:hypothetical protein
LTPSTPASPPDVRYRLENQDLMLKLDPINSGFAAGCEYRLENQDLMLKLDPINSGFAAGCEARLCLAVELY